MAYLPPSKQQTWSALAWAAVLLLGMAVLAPFAAQPMPRFNGFIPALDAIIFVTDIITASLLFTHVLTTRSMALLALACGYLFSALIVVGHGLSFPGVISATGRLGGGSQTTVRLYLFWHLALPVAVIVYACLRDKDRLKTRTTLPIAAVALCSVAGVVALVSIIVWIARGDELLPSALVGPSASSPVIPLLVDLTIGLCAVALGVVCVFRRSALDQWLMVIMLASIVELAITALFGGPIFSLGFYAGRVFSLVTSTAVLAALLAETTRLYARLGRENMLARLIDSNIIGIFVGNLDGQIHEANQAFLEIVGYEQADVEAGRLVRAELTPPDWHDRDAPALAELASVGTVQPYETEYFRKDGTRVPVLFGAATFGEQRYDVVAFVVDLTDRRRAEQELAHANRVAVMGQLTASIAHEVTQPVTGLLINAQTALNSLDGQPPNLEVVKTSIDRIISDGKRTSEIVNRIRDFSRKVPTAKGRLEINEAILEIIDLSRIPMSNNGVSAKIQLAESLPHISADRVQLQQVILNLVMNAIEAMTQVENGSRELSISTGAHDAGSVLVAVSDTGPGLPEDAVERIFEAFYTTKPNGLGMGLSICRSIVEAHGGRLWATPNQPRGAVFYMALP